MPKKIVRVNHPPPAPAEIARRLNERRTRDRISQLKDGFTFRPDGRIGFIYYREGDHLLELMWEIAGPDDTDIIVHLTGLQKWFAPSEADIETSKQKKIEEALRQWLVGNRVRAIFSDNRDGTGSTQESEPDDNAT